MMMPLFNSNKNRIASISVMATLSLLTIGGMIIGLTYGNENLSRKVAAVSHLVEVRQAFLAKDLAKMEKLVDFKQVSDSLVKKSMTSGKTAVNYGNSSNGASQYTTNMLVTSFQLRVAQALGELMMSEVRHYFGKPRTMSPKDFGVSENKMQQRLSDLEDFLISDAPSSLEVVPTDVEGHDLIKANIGEQKVYFLMTVSPRKVVEIRKPKEIIFKSRRG